MTLNKYDAISYLINSCHYNLSAMLIDKMKFKVSSSRYIITQVNTLYQHYIDTRNDEDILKEISSLEIELAAIDEKNQTHILTNTEIITRENIVNQILEKQNQISINNQVRSILSNINQIDSSLELSLCEYEQKYSIFNNLYIPCKDLAFELTQCYFDSVDLKNKANIEKNQTIKQNLLNQSNLLYSRFQNVIYFINYNSLQIQASNETDIVKKQKLLDESLVYYSRITTTEIIDFNNQCINLNTKFNELLDIFNEMINMISTLKLNQKTLETICAPTTTN